jgi:hypothetical protein
MLISHGLDKQGACFIGHSYGTFAISWILNYSPKLVSSIILIEPPCLILFHYHVCYNFLYKKLTKFFHLIVRYITARELSTAVSITR